MNTELQYLMQMIIDSKDPLKWLELVDAYIDLYNRSQTAFILPAAHAHLEVLVKAYAQDDVGFKNFVKAVRDEVPKSERIEIHKYYRKVNTRVSQRILRDRKWTTIKKIEDHLGLPFTSAQKENVYAWLTQYWAKQRSDFLNMHRSATSDRKLSTDQRTDLSEEFWDSVDSDLSNNIFPIPPEVVYAKLASLESYKPDSV